ncbi:hypothetical protein [Sphingobacterium multivorum]|uniref:hypothetical protein n=1 Tax=Sphingobacterium multivorum TaxID=28454 RepID=UPI000ED902EB|nr:hypothetical protein [Sphingobacterium multivorum]HAL54361.1 hypothetical protein [Sphingobacterium sp.]
MKFNPLLVIKLLLGLFICIGIALTIFMMVHGSKIVGAYVVSVLFILFPGIILYGMTLGFRVSEKTITRQIAQQESVTSDHKGISYQIPLLKTTQFISWEIIETIIYSNYHSDDQAQFSFYLTQPAIQIASEKPGWLAKVLLPLIKTSKKVVIYENCINFREIPKMLEKHFSSINPVDINEVHGKGTLLRSKTTLRENTIQIEEYWKPNPNFEPEKVIYDRYNRTIDEQKQSKNS